MAALISHHPCTKRGGLSTNLTQAQSLPATIMERYLRWNKVSRGLLVQKPAQIPSATATGASHSRTQAL